MPRIVPSQIVSFIDEIFPQAKEHKNIALYRNHSIHCSAIIDLIEKLPSELVVVPEDRYVELVSSIAAVKRAIEDWKYRDYPLHKTPGLKGHNPIVIIRDVLSMCPDEFPSEDTSHLMFIENEDLRNSLEIDLSSTNQALSNGEWKAATVIAGSIIEALLFWRLNNFDKNKIEKTLNKLVKKEVLTKKPNTNLKKWNLHLFIEVALELEIIGKDTAQQARLAKEYRNLIHPGREVRLNQKCDRGTALSAVAGVELVIRDFSAR